MRDEEETDKNKGCVSVREADAFEDKGSGTAVSRQRVWRRERKTGKGTNTDVETEKKIRDLEKHELIELDNGKDVDTNKYTQT